MVRSRAFWIAFLLLAVPAASADELEGLWKAKRRFGPDARGLLVIQRTDAAYSAEMVGRIVPVRSETGELAFDLPNGEGSFRGRHQADGAIAGHWFPPPSMAQFTGGRFVSPVRLEPDGPNRWSGQVVPFEDAFTFYLLARKRPDGTIGVFLRNPERRWSRSSTSSSPPSPATTAAEARPRRRTSLPGTSCRRCGNRATTPARPSFPAKTTSPRTGAPRSRGPFCRLYCRRNERLKPAS